MDITKVTSFHSGNVSGPLAEELYLNVIVAALQDPETGIINFEKLISWFQQILTITITRRASHKADVKG